MKLEGKEGKAEEEGIETVAGVPKLKDGVDGGATIEDPFPKPPVVEAEPREANGFEARGVADIAPNPLKAGACRRLCQDHICRTKYTQYETDVNRGKTTHCSWWSGSRNRCPLSCWHPSYSIGRQIVQSCDEQQSYKLSGTYFLSARAAGGARAIAPSD